MNEGGASISAALVRFCPRSAFRATLPGGVVMTDPLFARFGREYHAGDVLFMEGDTGEEMYVIQTGSVQVSKRIGDEERPLATLRRGEFLVEMALLYGARRPAGAL